MKRLKEAEKIFTSDQKKIQDTIVKTLGRISDIVGSTLGPGGRVVAIESMLPEIPHTVTKDGVTVFRSLGSASALEQLIIELTREAAIKTVAEAGDGPVPVHTKVLTPNGFITMGEVKEGMDICGTDGTIQKVLGVYPKGLKENYKVTFLGGATVNCCPDHLWTVTKKDGAKETLPLKKIMEDYKVIKKDGGISYKYYVQNTLAYFNENREIMPLHPYLVGLLIGDGSLTGTGSIELSLGIPKKHILDKIILPKGLYLKTSLVERKNYYRVKIQGETEDGKSIRDIVKEIGFFGVNSKTKFIPPQYLYSSKESRECLLQGIIDTDGHVNKSGYFEISTVSEVLANDILNLCRSLGSRTSIRLKNRENSGGYSKTPLFVVKEMDNKGYGSKIMDIQPTGKMEEMQCIKVSNPDNLYIMDDFVVTHNTTSSSILASAFTQNLFEFCKNNKKYPPQKAVRALNKVLNTKIIPYIEQNAIQISAKKKNLKLLEKVAKVSVNGDEAMAKAVIEAFEVTGYSQGGHITIQQLSGPSDKYEVSLIDGFPINMGYEESIGKFHDQFINDKGHLRCVLEKPLFILFDGKITDLVQMSDTLGNIGKRFMELGNGEGKNVVVVAHGFSENVLNTLAFNFNNENTINVLPFKTPINQIINSETHFLHDLSAFTGAKIFNMNNPINSAKGDEFGSNMDRIEVYRFRATIVGDSDPTMLEIRASEIEQQKKHASSKIEKIILDERLGKLTSGIAELKLYGASVSELKEKADRAEDAVLAVRSALSTGCLPGGCRVLANLALELSKEEDDIIKQIIVPSLYAPFHRLLENAGYNEDEIIDFHNRMKEDTESVLDVENGVFGKAEDLGIYDAMQAVKQSLINSVSISSTLGTLGGIVVQPRIRELELQDAKEELNHKRIVDNAENTVDEVSDRL